MNKKTSIARLSIISNSGLSILKLIVGILTGSVSIISESIHSTMDLIAAVIAFFLVKISSTPADEKHPYGHGKVENISGVIEAMLIFIASIWIIYEAGLKIMHPSEIESAGIGFLVMIISSIVNFLVSRKLYKVANEEDSIALKADVYTALGVGAGLLLIWITKIYFLDPIFAIVVAIFILREATHLLKEAFNPLLDIKLSDVEIIAIKSSINKHENLFCSFHNLRTRKSGNIKYIDVHVVFPTNIPMKKANDICNILE